ncbi:hypothetical protein L3Q82_021171, partial [Scortum barcoo]
GLLLQPDGIPYFRCPPPGSGVATPYDRHQRPCVHNFEPHAVTTMEAENMVHSDSMSPASLGICEKLFRRWELKTSLTEGSARHVPNRPSQYVWVCQNNGVPSRSTIKYPSQGLQEGRVLCTAVRPVGTNNSKRPIPNPKAQGSEPLSFTGVNSNTWRLSWGAISKPTPARRRSPWATPE